MQPTFITGATAKIRLNGKTLAFCQDFNCTVQVLTQTPKVLGKYEADSVEPLSYLVSGGFSIVRYAKGVRDALKGADGQLGGIPKGLAENDAGNGVGNWGTLWDGSAGGWAARNGFLSNNGRAHEALDPSKFATGTTFDIQVYQKVIFNPGSGNHTIQTTSGKVDDTLSVLSGGNLDGPGTGSNLGGRTDIDYLGVLNIRNARITQAAFGMSKRQVASERFTFVAIFVDGDGFVANPSGVL